MGSRGRRRRPLIPVFDELARQAAQGTVVYNDDTTMRILTLTQEARAEALPAGASADRTGMFTSGVVAETPNGLIALFKTGPCHAGEHLAEVLDLLFLRAPGAPLDNNITERILKKAILHRKNALFYRTLNGARVGDLFMTLIHTAELHQIEPFHYLVSLLRHSTKGALDPAAWMPWYYTEALARAEAQSTGPPPD